jgi:hypothetical protein
MAQAGCSAAEPPGTTSDALRPGFRCVMSRSLRHGSGDIAVDSRGDILVATGSGVRGEGLVSVIRKIDVSGKDIWAYHVPGVDELLPYSMTTDAAGAVIVVGRGFRTELLPNGALDIQSWLFLLKLDAAGHLDFRRDFEGSGHFAEVTTTPSGDIVLRGRYSSSLDLGAGPMPDSGGPSTSFIAMFHAAGNLLWTKDFGNPDEQSPLGIATDTSGAVLVAGRLAATFDFGGGPLTPTPNKDPYDDVAQDAYLVKYDAAGSHVWSRRFGGDGPQQFSKIATDAAGNAIVLSYNAGVMELGGKPFAGQSDIVAGFGPGGEHLFSAALPTIVGNAERIAVSASGEIFVGGTFQGTIDLDAEQLVSTGRDDIFVMRLDSRGITRAGVRFGGTEDEYLWGFAVSPKGRVALAGDFEGVLDIGCGPLSAGPDANAFVAAFTL